MHMIKNAILLAAAAAALAAPLFAVENKFTPIKETPAIWSNIPESLKSAKWLWDKYPAAFAEIVNTYCVGRKTFDLDAVPKKAPLFITADQSYRLFINGKFVCSGPARGYQHSWPFDEIDVAKYLKKGKNIIAVRAYNAGRSTFGYITQGRAGFIFALELRQRQKHFVGRQGKSAPPKRLRQKHRPIHNPAEQSGAHRPAR